MYIRELPERSLTDLRDEARADAPSTLSVPLSEVAFRLDDERAAWPHMEADGKVLALDQAGTKALAAYLAVPQRFLVAQPVEDQQYIVSRVARRKGGQAVISFAEEPDRTGLDGNLFVVDVKDPGQEVTPVHKYIDVARQVVGDSAIVVDYINDPTLFRLDVAVRRDSERGVGGEGEAVDIDGVKVDDLAGGGISIEQNRTRNLAPVISTHLFRYVCTNGMVVTDDTLKIDLRNVSADDLLLEMRDKVDRAFRRVEGMIEDFYKMKHERVENPHARLLALGREWGIPDRTLMSLQDSIPAEFGDTATMFDIVNLISNMANEPSVMRKPSSMRRFQSIAGGMVGDHHQRCKTCQQAVNN